jgi:hypothetical protein
LNHHILSQVIMPQQIVGQVKHAPENRQSYLSSQAVLLINRAAIYFFPIDEHKPVIETITRNHPIQRTERRN